MKINRSWFVFTTAVVLLLFVAFTGFRSVSAVTKPNDAVDDILCGPDFIQLIYASSLIVSGRVMESESRWNEKKTMIHTYSTFLIHECIKSDISGRDQIIVRTYGGKVGTIGQIAVGGPKLDPGKDYILFLIDPVNNTAPVYDIYGLSRGVFTVHWNASSAADSIVLIKKYSGNIGLFTMSSTLHQNALLHSDGMVPARITYSEFSTTIRQLAHLKGGAYHD